MKHSRFPPVHLADAEGLLCVGGALEPDWILEAYGSGIFPWFNEDDPILWWSPDPRYVLVPSAVKIQKSMRPLLNSQSFAFKLDTAFNEVIMHCASVVRPGQSGTWLHPDMREAYTLLHKEGYAHSAEIWCDGSLVGGLYGLSLGGMFFGESMFSLKPNMSKLAFIRLCAWLHERGFDLIDCQVHTRHLQSLGAQPLPRQEFMQILDESLHKVTLKGNWQV